MPIEPLPADVQLPLEVTRQIDALCDDFERTLKQGGGPQLEQFLHRIDPEWRQPLLKELTELLLERLRADGTIRAEDAVLDANPSLRDELSSIVRSSQDVTVSTDGHQRRRDKAAGLSVRCPHCHAMIPLVVDASLMEILCDQCGGTFSLVNDAEETRDAPVLSRVAHFEIVERLGMGEFGTVWKARDTLLDRTVALKIPRREQLDPLSVEKFMREARAAAQLRHPNIVSTHEVGREGDTLYIVIDYVRGVPLSLMMADHRLAMRESVEMLAKIAAALDHAHLAGVIHRDLKPSNILVDDLGEPHLMDFGLAKRKELEVSITTEGAILGTPAYMSPEQARGEANRVDGRSDVYSAGVILFQLLTGELPFRGSTRMLLQKVINDDAPGPRTLESRVPRDLDTICLKCLEKEPARRYATARELADDLHRFLDGQPVHARRLGRAGRTIRWTRRNPVIAALLAATTATLLVATGVSLYFASQAGQALGDSLLQEIRLTREVRRQGYGEKVHELVAQIRSLPFARVDENELRREVSLTLGDIAARRPLAIVPSSGSVNAVSLCDESQELFVGLSDGTLEVYDARSGELHSKAKAADDPIAALAVSESGDRVATANRRGEVQVWHRKGDSFSMQHVHALGKDPHAIVFAPDGAQAAFLKRAQLEIWDLEAEKRPASLPTEPGWSIRNAAFDLAAGQLAAGFVDSNAKSAGWAWWDLQTRKRLGQVQFPDLGETYVNDIAFSTSADLVAVGFDLGLRWSRLSAANPASIPVADSTLAVAVDPATSSLAAVNIRGLIQIWNLATGRQTAALQLPMSMPSECGLQFGGNGATLIAANAELIQVWDLRQADDVTVLAGHPAAVPCAAFHPSGEMLATGGKDNRVNLWNPASGQLIDSIDVGEQVQTIAFSPDGRTLAVGCMEGVDAAHLRAIDIETRQVIHTSPVTMDEVLSLSWSKCGARQYLAGSGSRGVAVWKVADQKSLQCEPVFEKAGNRCLVSVFDCASSILVWEEANRLHAWDLGADRALPLRAPLMNQGWHGLALLPDGESVTYVSDAGVAESWDVRHDRHLDSCGAPGTFHAPQIALSADGDWLAALTQPDTVSIWHRPSGQHLLALRPATAAIWSLAWDPTGQHLAVGQSDGGVSVWHLAKIREQFSALGLDWHDD